MEKPPPYSERQSKAPVPLNPPPWSAPPMGSGRPGPVPPPYQPYYGPHGAAFNQGPVLHPPRAIFITSVQRVDEPDYLVYSIFTMFCCCLPIGIAALIYSIKTRSANNAGDGRAAREYSALTLTLAHAALGVGLLIIILGNILRLIIASYVKKSP